LYRYCVTGNETSENELKILVSNKNWILNAINRMKWKGIGDKTGNSQFPGQNSREANT